MPKIKLRGIITGGVLIAAAGAGLWLWHPHGTQKQSRIQRPSAGNSSLNLTPTSDPNSIPLTPTEPSANTGGLRVAPSSPADNLGQLTPGQTGSNGSAAGSASAPKALDPATFKQYDKYKDSQTALFGELQTGSGDQLVAGKKAAVLYKGWLSDGRLFDQSPTDKNGNLQPFAFTLGAHEVIPGWEEGLSGMKLGGTRLVIVPPAVGYGAAGHDPIPPNAVLIFEVQLLAVQ